VLATPPALRQPVRTVVAPYDAEAVREALIRKAAEESADKYTRE